MWSAWSEPVDLYLGQGLAVIGRARGQAEVVQFPPTLPLDRILQRAGEAAGPLLRAGAAMRIRLSGTLCPATTFDVPQGLSGWRELEQIATASIAAQMNLPATDVVVQMDASHIGLAAALVRPFLEAIQSWAKGQQLAVASIAPAWAEAAACKGAQSGQVRAIAVSEPDCITFVVETAGSVVAATAHRPKEGIQALNRALAAHGVPLEALLKLGFSPEQGEATHGLPRFLARNWSAR